MAVNAKCRPAESFAHMLFSKTVMRQSFCKNTNLNAQNGQETSGNIRLRQRDCMVGDGVGPVTQDVSNQGFELSSPERMAAGGQVGHAINTIFEVQDYSRCL